MPEFLVVGAGLAGAVHARVLAERGHTVDIIDRRDHIGGNAYDFIDDNGIRRHRYGPHLFHTNNDRVVEWLSRFTDWVPYEHRVRALLPSGQDVPLPINRETINTVFGLKLKTPAEVESYVKARAAKIVSPANAAEYLYSRIGDLLTNLFFRPYTCKMWAHELEDMAVSVVQRIPLRWDDEDRYFPSDRFQMLPRDGYTRIFERMLEHTGISVHLSTPFDKTMEQDYKHVFTSMAIDEYFDFDYGDLPYRSIRFHHVTDWAAVRDHPSAAVMNFTDAGPLTRETRWHLLPHHLIWNSGRHTRTGEEPCDYRDNGMERYYPIKTADNRYQTLYQRYKALSEKMGHVSFIGRCGTYQYLDMDQVINQSLRNIGRFLDST